jgi:dihydrofolate reductase
LLTKQFSGSEESIPMGRIVSNFFISLDGVVEAPDQWHFPYFDDDMGAVVGQGFATTDAMLMGRKLYSEWSEYWPEHADDDFGQTINNMPKYVVSDSLEDATWTNSTLVRGNEAADRLRQLRTELDGDLTLSGCATTVRWLLPKGCSTSFGCWSTRSRSVTGSASSRTPPRTR